MSANSGSITDIDGIGEGRAHLLTEELGIREPADFLFYTVPELVERLRSIKPGIAENRIAAWHEQATAKCRDVFGNLGVKELPQPARQPWTNPFADKSQVAQSAQADASVDWEPFAQFIVDYASKTINGKTRIRTTVQISEHGEGAGADWWGIATREPGRWIQSMLENEYPGLLDPADEQPDAPFGQPGEVAESISVPKKAPQEISAAQEANVRGPERPASLTDAAMAGVDLLFSQHLADATVVYQLPGKGAGTSPTLAAEKSLQLHVSSDAPADNVVVVIKSLHDGSSRQFKRHSPIAASRFDIDIDALASGSYALTAWVGSHDLRRPGTLVDAHFGVQ